MRLFVRGREHVVVHPDHHRDEDDRVVEEVKLDAWNPDLRDAQGHGRAEQVLPQDGLRLKKRVLDVVPELNAERDRPPGQGAALESAAHRPDADEHDQGVGVMQQLRFDQKREPVAENPARFGDRPAEHIDLKSLNEMLGPVRQHDDEKDAKSRSMPFGVELFVKPSRRCRR